MDYKIIYKALEDYFHPETCTEVFDTIGESFHNTDDIQMAYTACFASDEMFQKLEALGAHDCMVFTHHPTQQKDKPMPSSPKPSQWAKDFMNANRINLFTYHIPLDRNSLYSPGNNLAKALGIVPYDEFYLQNQVLMGVICNSNFKTQQEVADKLEKVVGHEVKLYAYGPDELNGGRIAIMAGGASNPNIYEELRQKGVSLFITGITTQIYDWTKRNHTAAKEAGVSILGGTHYSTEKFAPMSMVTFFENLGVPSQFIEETPMMWDM